MLILKRSMLFMTCSPRVSSNTEEGEFIQSSGCHRPTTWNCLIIVRKNLGTTDKSLSKLSFDLPEFDRKEFL